jgi:hypothetical protein
MRQETNNEIDLLLRRLGRRQGASALDGDHLDADELSAFAENALPAAVRARYTEHLAECSRCRELVVQLSSAAGVMVAEEPSRVAVPSGLRKFLTSLFSPMVLRYAVPAMGLIVVAAIGFTVFRRQEPNNSPGIPARQQVTDTPAVAQQTNPQPEEFIDKQDKFGSPVAKPELRGQRKEVEAPAPNATPEASKTTDFAAEPPVQKTESQTVASAATPAPAAPKPAETADEIKKVEPAARQDAQSRTGAANVADKEKAAQPETAAPASVATTRRPAKTRALTAAEAQGAGAPIAQKLSEDKSARDAQKDRDDAGETRSVAGRRFRKKGGVWVDTAYAGGETMDLPRGSERYRSLVGDEPAIKNIADELDGQIIVVWKGRAYKIH